MTKSTTALREEIAQQIQYAMDEAKAIDKYFGDFAGVKQDRTDAIMQLITQAKNELLHDLLEQKVKIPYGIENPLNTNARMYTVDFVPVQVIQQHIEGKQS